MQKVGWGKMISKSDVTIVVPRYVYLTTVSGRMWLGHQKMYFYFPTFTTITSLYDLLLLVAFNLELHFLC